MGSFDSDSFDVEEYSRRELAAREAGSAASSRKPRRTSFGFFAYGDAPGAIGGGIGLFEWFPSRKALLDHIAEHLTFENPGQSDKDAFAVHAAVKRAVDKFRQSAAPLRLLVPKLNPLLRTFSQITWIGTFRDLKEGNGKYERELRRQFRDSLGSNKGSRPIARAESAEFLEFLQQYGF